MVFEQSPLLQHMYKKVYIVFGNFSLPSAFFSDTYFKPAQ